MPWKRSPLKPVWSCGLPGCEHRYWIFAWLHGRLVPRPDARAKVDINPSAPPDPSPRRSDIDEFSRRVRGPK